MTDDEIIHALRSDDTISSPSEVISLLIKLKEGRLSQFDMIRYFGEAFKVPVGILKEASTSRLVIGAGGLEDEEIDALLGPWFRGGNT